MQGEDLLIRSDTALSLDILCSSIHTFGQIWTGTDLGRPRLSPTGTGTFISITINIKVQLLNDKPVTQNMSERILLLNTYCI